MHPALQIPEVLLNIFGHSVPSGFSDEDSKRANRDLAALARTCRAFKEPALDILWSELRNPTPLARCLPEIFYSTGRASHRPSGEFNSFSRPLERVEWDIFRSYARRVWCISDSRAKFDWETVRRTFLAFTPADPLFPSLRSLHCEFAKETTPLLQLPLPSLIRLSVHLPSKVDLRVLEDPLRSLVRTSPKIKKLDVWCFDQREITHAKIVSDAICGWSNLQSVACPQIPLDVDALIHLSRMPILTYLSFSMNGAFPAQTIPSGSPSFTTLNLLRLHAISLDSISRLLSWVKIPSITDFKVTIDNCPSKQALASFMAGLQIAGMAHTIQQLELEQVHEAPDTIPPREPDAPLLDFDDLRPCMILCNLCHMNLDLQWDVDLSDDELLMLASAWPQIKGLLINAHWGWNRPGGISPGGLASLLQLRPSLVSIALAIDTRGYTELPDRRRRKPPNASSFGCQFHLNVLDSEIEEESVDAMAVALSGVVPHFDFTLTAWETWSVLEHPHSDLYQERWERVQRQTYRTVKKQWLDFLQLLFQQF